MKTYGKDCFLPYSMEVMEAVLQEPYRLDPVPESERAEITVETPMKWTFTLHRPGRNDIIYDCEASYDASEKTCTIGMTSRVKKLRDECILTLYRVGDVRTRMHITYNIRYNMLIWTHAMTRIRTAMQEHRPYVDAVFHLIDKAEEVAAEKQRSGL